jgi:phosphotransferase system, enzyme I, PtsP
VLGVAVSRSIDRLAALSRIVQEVDQAADLESALQVVVQRTRAVMRADVCTIYFSDDARRRHVIAATDGISARYVGTLAIDFGSGIIGRVAQEQRPINLDRVPEALDQGFLAQTGLEPYAGFLGVPILYQGRVQGVLLVRQRLPRCFDDGDAAFLSTLASQLGGAIAYATSSGDLYRGSRPEKRQYRPLEGLAGAPGIAMGTGRWVFSATELGAVPTRPAQDPAVEEARFFESLQRVKAQTQDLAVSLQGRIPQADRALFDAFTMILESPELRDGVVGFIRQGQWAPSAVRHAIEAYAEQFDAMDDAYLQQRAADVRALGTRIISRLLGDHPPVSLGAEPTILIGNRLTAMDIGEALSGQLVGMISADGSTLSHAAILARSLAIPAVMGITKVPLTYLDGQTLIVDGHAGRIHVRPDPATQRVFQTEVARRRARNEALEPIRRLPAETTDGKRISLMTNGGLMATPDQPSDVGSDGIGLFRSELPFMMFERFPSEAEQQALYRLALTSIAPLPLVLRTLDAGGDKPLPYLSEDETNPALGWRGIRFALDHPDIFLTQVRAALLANVGVGNLRLMLPMVSALEEVAQAKGLIDRAIEQLHAEGVSLSHPSLGVMIEVPAAIFQAERLAGQVDFVSVGTNDLMQYLLAADRNNPRVSSHLNPLHPALLQALHLIATSAHRAGRPVTVCGEMASDPVLAMILVGMGFDGLSINPTAILEVKSAIRRVSFCYLQSLAQQVLLAEDPETVHHALADACVQGGIPESRCIEGRGPGASDR